MAGGMQRIAGIHQSVWPIRRSQSLTRALGVLAFDLASAERPGEIPMRRSGRVSIAIPRDEIEQVRGIVEAGEFASTAAVMREALRAFLHRRALHAGQFGAARLSRTLQARLESLEPAERVDLLFDAGDAKA